MLFAISSNAQAAVVFNIFSYMDYFGWECSTAATNVASSQSSQLHQMGDSLIPINGAPIEPFHADLKQKSNDMVQKVAPTEPTTSPNYAANFNYLWRQAAMKLAADSVLAKSEASSSAEFSSSVKTPHVIDPSNGLISDLVMPELRYPQYIDGKATIATNTGSLESLDCLLSTNNIIRNTSVEDDDFNSILHSDCKNLWNFSSISAVDSENNITNITDKYCSSLTNEVIPQFSPKRTNHRIGVISEPELKRPRLEKLPSSSNINFQQSDISSECTNCTEEPDPDTSTQMKEMIYRAAAFRPVNIEEMEAVEKPKRKNVKISSDPQTVAARQRREKISEKIRVLQKLVPVGNKLDTASILDEAANYLKFLRSQVKALESAGHKFDFVNCPINPLLYHFPHHFLLPFNHSFPMQPNHDFSCSKPH